MFGDYDVDGACSAALLQRFLAAHGLDARIYIPDRMTEGYGPNAEAIEAPRQRGRQADRHGRLRHDQRRAAGGGRGRSGADVIVVDHHQADERLPDVAAVVNPNRQDDLSGLGHLCAAGVVFMLLVATHARAAQARLLQRRDSRRPICWRCSIWWRSPPFATWCRSRASTAPT